MSGSGRQVGLRRKHREGGREIETEMANRVMETQRDTKTETGTRRKVQRPRECEADKESQTRDRAIQSQAQREMNGAGFQRQTGREKRRTNHRGK